MKLPSHSYSWRHLAWRPFLQSLQLTNWPIFVGPWTGEVGFEVLYWIPFITKLVEEGLDPARLIPISRGGAACWYSTPVGMELYTMRTPQQVRIETRLQAAKSGMQKQITRTAFDEAILRDAAAKMRIEKYHVLHPAWMYHRLAQFWTAKRGFEWLFDRAAYPPLPVPQLPDGVTLPEPFVAVRFYARPTFPYNAKAAHQLAEATVRQLAEQSAVVLLESNAHTDEHVNFKMPAIPNVYRLRDLVPGLTAETNLMIQAAVIGKAVGFVGTYGGLSQLALRLGRPSVNFYLEWEGTSTAHKHLSDLVGEMTGAPFHVLRLRDLAMLQSVMPRVQMAQPPLASPSTLHPAVV